MMFPMKGGIGPDGERTLLAIIYGALGVLAVVISLYKSLMP